MYHSHGKYHVKTEGDKLYLVLTSEVSPLKSRSPKYKILREFLRRANWGRRPSRKGEGSSEEPRLLEA